MAVSPHRGERTHRCRGNGAARCAVRPSPRQGAPQGGGGGGAMADYEAVQRGPLRLKGSGGALGAGKR